MRIGSTGPFPCLHVVSAFPVQYLNLLQYFSWDFFLGDKSYSAPPRGVAWEPSFRRRAKQRGISGFRLAMKVVQASQPTLRGASRGFPTGFPSVRARWIRALTRGSSVKMDESMEELDQWMVSLIAVGVTECKCRSCEVAHSCPPCGKAHEA